MWADAFGLPGLCRRWLTWAGTKPYYEGHSHTHARLKCVNLPPRPAPAHGGLASSAQSLFPQHQGGHPGWCGPGAPLWVWTLRLPSVRWDQLHCTSAVLLVTGAALVGRRRLEGAMPWSCSASGGRPGPGFPVKWSRCYPEDAACVGSREEDHLCSFSQSVFVKSPRWATLYGRTKTGIHTYTHS